MKDKKASFQFRNFKVLKSIIEIDEDQKKFKNFDFGLDIKGIYHKSDKHFKLYLNMIIENEDKNFLCEVQSVGYFHLTSDDKDFVENFLFTNAPALLFPYLRAYISNLTTQSGIDSVVLPTMNLSRIVQEEFKDKFEIIE